MPEIGFVRAIFGLDAPLLRRRRLRYGIGHVSREQIAEAARRAKVERVIRDLRELGHAGLAHVLELTERNRDSERNRNTLTEGA